MDMKVELLQYIKTLMKPRFQDITPMFNDSVPFLVSGEMLMLTALTNENYSIVLGGQSLHMIYICERLLNVFKKNNGSFEFVFFDIWKEVLENEYLILCRQMIMEHFKNNTSIPVHNFDSVYDTGFSELIDNVRPGFLLYNLSHNYLFRSLKQYKCNACRYLALFCSEFTFCLGIDFPVVDIGFIDTGVSNVKSYLLESNTECMKLPNLRRIMGKTIVTKRIPKKKLDFAYRCNDIREFLVCNAVCVFLKDFPKRENDAKLFVLYAVALENLKLHNRGCPIVNVIGDTIKNDVMIWQKILLLLLESINDIKMEWKNIADIWQGTLLAVVYSSVTDELFNVNLGEFAPYYEQYIDKINNATKQTLLPYPIKPYENKICEFTMPYCRKAVEVPLQPVENVLVTRFCGNFIKFVKWADPNTVLEEEHRYFDEIRHWHSRRQITDDYDKFKEDKIDMSAQTKNDLARYQRSRDFTTKWINTYGLNLIGKAEVYESVIYDDGSKSLRKTKESNSANKLKLKINEEKAAENRKREKEKLSLIKRGYKVACDVNQLMKVKTELEHFIPKICTKTSLLDSLMLKVKILDKICSKLLKGKVKISDENIESLFLTVRDILEMHHSNDDVVLEPKQQKVVSKILHNFGFSDIAAQNCLPPIENASSNDSYINEDCVRFQLKRLGPKLIREVTGDYDEDVGFTPDPWQKNLIEAIRKNQSALVIAPTSSGKTFASYYCMKRVLQKSKDGIVVYVSPTKALVNQVAATITVKFRGFKSQPGVSTVGVFTRDYRINGLNSRILVTVPQCLEILLMSPRRYTWSKNIKYVIFDEVHCLKGCIDEATGITWERCILLIRCPFLALSATVRNPESFHEWLVTAEKFKEQEDLNNGVEKWYDSKVHLEVYSERHADLIKYTYLQEEGLQPCHPYSFLDHDILKLYHGIPEGTSLSSLEVLQLYDAIKAHAPQSVTGEAEIKTFFAKHSKKGFITHRDVKNFEKLLGEIFFELYQTDLDCYKLLLRDLQPARTVTYADVGFLYCRKNIIDLITILYNKNMLPALIFSYNRNYIEVLCQEIVEYFESLVVEVDRRDLKKQEKMEKKEKKQLHKLEAKLGDSSNSFKQAHRSNSVDLLMETASFLKSVGLMDKDDLECIETRLRNSDGFYKDILIRSMRQGVAFHHAGLNNKFRSSIEMLFRMGLLKVVFATGTLAMGIHMPCKTVVVCGDSLYLNSLEYHQMAGRAGRRGFDNEGNVIFMGLNKRRQKTLLTSRLPIIDGNFPLTVTFILRLLLLVERVTDSKEQTEDCRKRTLSSVLTLLENNLSYMKFPMLRDQMKHFFCFSTQLLYLQKLIGINGMPLQLCSIVTHLHYHEPANLAFVYILRTGAIREMIKQDLGNDSKIQWNLVIVLNFLFARLVLHESQKEYLNSCVVLEKVPGVIKNALKQYNKQVNFVFNEYFTSVSKYCTENLGPDNKLPLSKLMFDSGVSAVDSKEDTILNKISNYCQRRTICSAFCSLSSHGDDNLYSEQDLISNIRDDVYPDVKIVPIIDLDLEVNSYAADFYRHGIKQSIIKDNGLKYGQDFTLLKDFFMVLNAIVLTLEELEPVNENDVILHHFRIIQSTYRTNFYKAYGINNI